MLPGTLRRTLGIANPMDLVDSELGQVMNRLWNQGQPMDNVGVYPVDIREDENHIFVEAEMPGFTKDQINITLENSVLTIQAQRSEKSPNQGEGQSTGQSREKAGVRHLSERRYTRISRAFSLPNTVDENKVDAKLENGVLHLTLHKREEVKPRRIEVK